MEYPIWNLTTFGGGFFIALIATVHVFVAQFAVGGGLFLVLTERYAYRRESPAVLDYVKRHSLFFLLLSMVFGALTGVAIWFTIALLSPQGTIVLIHNFVFAWASEWVFFLGEIVALLVYYYGWKRLSRRDHMIVGWLYFLFAWGSLFLINGIVAFMLTPGQWITTGDFWDGFFNPTFWPQLVFRTFLSFTIAGLFGFVTATRIADDHERMRLVRLCSLWTILPFVLMVASGWWYITGLPEPQFTIAVERSHRVGLFLRDFVTLSPILVLGALLLAVRLPRKVSFPLALVVLLLGLGVSGSFEFMREAARKPFVVYGDIWSNSVEPARLAEIDERGAIACSKWAPPGLKVEDTLAAGQFLFQLECASCHSIGGPMNDILPRTAKYPLTGMDSLITGLGRINRSMPPFAGTAEERMALATYIVEGLHGKKDTGNQPFARLDLPYDMPPFNPADPAEGGSKYVLLGWNNLGMHCISDSNRNWVLLPPANDIFAQLVERGDPPSVVNQGVVMEYAVEDPFLTPAKHTDFWQYAHIIFGLDKPLPEGVGLAGNGVTGTMKLDENGAIYEAKLIPVVPYPDDRPVNPYPLFTITAKDEQTGEVLAQTRIVAPTSTEMGCKNCHGGPWKEGDLAGISNPTGYDVLTTHDRMSGTDLARRADAGKPVLCQSCHPDPVLGSKGDPDHYPGLMNLPAALHGLHANYLTGRGAEACAYCHPNRPDGPTRCLRGRHAEVADCTDCHGFLEDHALSLLKGEAGKRGSDRLMANLSPRTVAKTADVNPRTPWLGEPDCLNCHQDFQAPGTNAYNTWTKDGAHLYRNRLDDMGAIACIGCHNSPHAVWPADNIYGQDRDNIVPIQHMGTAGSMGTGGNCICHTVPRDFSAHHDNMWPR